MNDTLNWREYIVFSDELYATENNEFRAQIEQYFTEMVQTPEGQQLIQDSYSLHSAPVTITASRTEDSAYSPETHSININPVGELVWVDVLQPDGEYTQLSLNALITHEFFHAADPLAAWVDENKLYTDPNWKRMLEYAADNFTNAYVGKYYGTPYRGDYYDAPILRDTPYESIRYDAFLENPGTGNIEHLLPSNLREESQDLSSGLISYDQEFILRNGEMVNLQGSTVQYLGENRAGLISHTSHSR